MVIALAAVPNRTRMPGEARGNLQVSSEVALFLFFLTTPKISFYPFAIRELRIAAFTQESLSMKPQDIVVLVKLFLLQNAEWSMTGLAESIRLSASETHAAIGRLTVSALLDTLTRKPNRAAMEEFLLRGMKYVFPATIGAQERGMPTAHSAPFWKGKIIFDEADIYVWPYENGKNKGIAILPLYKTAPLAAECDTRLYDMLALLDVIRVGRKRELKIAEEELIRIIREQ
jgi:hypothetical protein